MMLTFEDEAARRPQSSRKRGGGGGGEEEDPRSGHFACQGKRFCTPRQDNEQRSAGGGRMISHDIGKLALITRIAKICWIEAISFVQKGGVYVSGGTISSNHAALHPRIFSFWSRPLTSKRPRPLFLLLSPRKKRGFSKDATAAVLLVRDN